MSASETVRPGADKVLLPDKAWDCQCSVLGPSSLRSAGGRCWSPYLVYSPSRLRINSPVA